MIRELHRKARHFLEDPEYRICKILLRKVKSERIPDRLYLKYQYHYIFGYPLNLKDPDTFNEKLQWLKLYDRNPLYTTLADKYAVKEWVAEKIGRQYVISTLAVYDNVDQIDLKALPEKFVLKCTHDSGSVVICRDKKSFDLETAKKKLEEGLGNNFFYKHREWPYKNIKPRIIADVFLDDNTGKELRDYKFWCFNGTPVYMYCTIKGDSIYENFYDMEFNPVMIDHGFPRHQPEFDKPSKFELMRDLATTLSKGIPFVRVDFFQVEKKVYFGEFTFYDWAGLWPFRGDWDIELGKLIDIHK